MSLETVDEIERAIATLASRQIEDLYAWLDRNFPQRSIVEYHPTLLRGA
jgi:hypothetical protein